MVLTRRAAKAAAEAASKNDNEPPQADDSTSNSPLTAQHSDSPPASKHINRPAASEQIDPPAAGEQIDPPPTSRKVDPPPHHDQIDPNNMPPAQTNDALKEPADHGSPSKSRFEPATKSKLDGRATISNGSLTSIKAHLRYGHVLACAAITVAAHAAGRIESEALPIHALFLLACAVPLRLLLALSAQNHDTTLSLSRSVGLLELSKFCDSGLSLALNAPFIFASNTLHLLASKADRAHVRTYVAASATQVASAWLSMAVMVVQPTNPRYVVARSLLDSVADVFLAAIVGGQSTLQFLFRPLFFLRIITDLYRLGFSLSAMVARDEREKSQSRQSTQPPS